MSNKLERALGFKDLTMIVVGTVIGSGIFIVPATVLHQTGESVWIALLVWLLGGILSLLGALTYGELGAMFPEAGGLYVYLRDAFGPLLAFLYGWSLFFLIGSGSVATLAVAFSSYLNQLLPLTPFEGRVVSILMIIVVAAINVRGVRSSASVQNWTTGIKVAAILLMSALLIVNGSRFGEGGLGLPSDLFSLKVLSSMGLAVVGVLWAYEGWHYVSFSTGETVNPQRIFARAITVATVALIGIYLVANVAYIAALGPSETAASQRPAAQAVSVTLGPAAGNFIALAILISMFSAANGVTLTSTRVYFAMANDGLFFRKLGEVHPRFKTPALAVVWSSLWAILMAATGTFEQLLTYVVFAGWFFYALGAASLLVFRRTRAATERPFLVPGYPVTPLLFILVSFAIVLNTVVSQPERGLVGLGMVLLGTPAYYFWRRRLKTASDSAK
jgi:APA family basic amino acid/polyamine antiporter